jgi:two-component system response regulator CpxR
MWNFFIYGEKFTDTQEMSKELASKTGFAPVTDKDVLTWADQRFGFGYSKLSKAFFKKKSLFENMTHSKQRTIAYLKSVLAENLEKNDSVYIGLTGHLLPEDFPQIYRIFITADTSYRINRAFTKSHPLPERQAIKEIQRADENAFRWCRRAYDHTDWDTHTYHMVLPIHILNKNDAIRMALEGFRKFMHTPTPTAQQALKDFQLTARVELALVEKGFPVKIRAKNQKVFVTVEKHVLRLSKLSYQLTQEIMAIKGVKEVEIGVGRDFNQADLCCHTTFETSLATQMNQFETNHSWLRNQAISNLPAKIKNVSRQPLTAGLHLRTM